MRVMRVSALAIPVALALGSLASAGPVLAAVCDGSTTSIGNGTFETPVVTADTYSLLPAADVPPWQTTDGLGQIEIWGTGFLGVPAFEGNAFAELNANTAGTLYQDVVSTPGSTLTWTLVHRAREGDDTMVVLIGDANVADVGGSTGWDYTSSPITDGVTAWGTHGDSFVVPAGHDVHPAGLPCSEHRIGERLDRQLSRRGGLHGHGPAPAAPAAAGRSASARPDRPCGWAPIPTPPPTDAVAVARDDGADSGIAVAIAVLAAAVAVAATRRRTSGARD